MMHYQRKLRCWVEIDLGSLERNLRHIRAALPRHVRYIAVVKADAYGHGMAPVVSRLMHSGASMFAVANLREAMEIREIGSGWPILVLSAILPEEDEDIVDLGVTPTVSTLEECRRFAAVGRAAGRPQPVHIKIDTGMGRLGVWHTEAPTLIESVLRDDWLVLDGIFTHFSCADMDLAVTRAQRDLFLEILSHYPEIRPERVVIHADNSAGLESFPRGGMFNAVRVGLLQFGVRPQYASVVGDVPVAPVISFHSRVGIVKQLPEGTGISYGQTCRLTRSSRVAVVTAGYGDGVPTAMSNVGSVLLHGRLCPILGRVTMDQTIVDVTDVPETVVPGDVVTFIGKQGTEEIDVRRFCRWAQHIPWEVFCSITKRVQRIYRIDSHT